jgi:hypothetical protein
MSGREEYMKEFLGPEGMKNVIFHCHSLIKHASLHFLSYLQVTIIFIL